MWSLFFLTPCLLGSVSGHGRLMDPPARNSMWRFGYINPINYNDNEVFCGGMDHQFKKNEGRCGICGDAYDAPSPQSHETGGNYGNAVITKTYVMGSVIDIEVELTANHKGRFALKVCPVMGRRAEATQACLDSNPLRQLDGEEEFPIQQFGHNILIRLKAQLPEGLSCSRCVLQWTWTSANSWGACSNGTQGLGCGPQETFRNCADLKIVTSASELPATDNPRAIMVRDSGAKGGMRALVVRSQVCVATAAYRRFGRNMDTWCQHNCHNYPPHCPPAICTCPTSCTSETGSTLDDFECNKRCLRYPFDELCPKSCSCSSGTNTDFSALDAVIIDARSLASTKSVSGELPDLVQTFLAWLPRQPDMFRLAEP